MIEEDKNKVVEIEKYLPEALKQLEVLVNKIEEINDYIYGKPAVSSEGINSYLSGISEDILNEEVIKKKHKKWKHVTSVLEVYRKNRNNPLSLTSNLNSIALSIQQDSPELAKELAKFKLLNSEDFAMFWDLYTHLRLIIKNGSKVNGSKVPSYLLNEYTSIHEDIGKIKNKEIAKRLQALLEITSGAEIKYLEEQLQDLQTISPENHHLKSNLSLYIKSLEEGMKKINISDRYLLEKIKDIEKKDIALITQEIYFLNQSITLIQNWGANENNFIEYVKEAREILRKIRTEYKDPALFSKFLLIDVVKKMVFFVEEYNYVKNIFNLIEKSYTSEKDWHDFINLVNNAHHINSALSLKFGDKKLGNDIEEFAKKNKDDIKAWKEYIGSLMEKEFRSVVRQKEIITECQKESIQIIITRKAELENELKNSDKSIENFIKLRIEQLERKKESALNEMFKTVRKEIKTTIEQIKKIYNHIKDYEDKIKAEWQKEVVKSFLEMSEQLKNKQTIWIEKHLDLRMREDKENASVLFAGLNNSKNSANLNLNELNKMSEDIESISIKDQSSTMKIENIVTHHMQTLMNAGGILGMNDAIELKAGVMIEKGLSKLLKKCIDSINASNEIISAQTEIVNYHKKIIKEYFDYEDNEREQNKMKEAA